ncbi:MAG: radical SAM protein [Elusimicrobiales bacterium]|nr:radical SAM protein [Elusimicrobiales bacterium]
MNKEIHKLKIALTSKCTLNCIHCNIDKNSNLKVNIKNSIKAVEILLNSPGNKKRLELYGGEPFLEFNNLRKIVSYARKKSKQKGISLSIHIATNATFIGEHILKWLSDTNDVIIAISFNGTRFSHDNIRKFSNGRGSYDIVKKNIKNILSAIGKDRTVIIYCVDPFFTKNMLNDFMEIISTGIRIIDIECAYGRGWSKQNYEEFKKNIQYINDYIMKKAKIGDFIFHEKFIELLRTKGQLNLTCPMYLDLEMYPDGKLGFYPYAFINYDLYKKYITIGNVSRGINKKFLNCELNSIQCNQCVYNYYTIEKLWDGNPAYKMREYIITSFFHNIIKNIKKRKYLLKYLIKLKRIVDVFYP